MVVLVSEPVRGRSRATELPCFPCSDFLSQMWGGGVGVMFFLHFMLFPTEKLFFHLMFSSCFFMLDLFPTFFEFFGNIE